MSRTTRDSATPINLFRLQDFHPLWSNFPERFVYKFTVGCRCPTTPAKCRFRLIPVRSPLLRESLLLSFPVATKMFQFTTFASFRMTGLQPAGLPHSEIPGSKLAYSYPRLIAVRHVLLRHLVRRHPPYALCAFTKLVYSHVLYSYFSYTAESHYMLN